MSYDNPTSSTYSFLGATLSSAATIGRIAGVAGKQGRVLDVSVHVTTGITALPDIISVGITGTLGKFATASIPISSADSVESVAPTQVANISSGEAVLVSTGGECTAGAGDVFVTVEWS